MSRISPVHQNSADAGSAGPNARQVIQGAAEEVYEYDLGQGAALGYSKTKFKKQISYTRYEVSGIRYMHGYMSARQKTTRRSFY